MRQLLGRAAGGEVLEAWGVLRRPCRRRSLVRHAEVLREGAAEAPPLEAPAADRCVFHGRPVPRGGAVRVDRGRLLHYGAVPTAHVSRPEQASGEDAAVLPARLRARRHGDDGGEGSRAFRENHLGRAGVLSGELLQLSDASDGEGAGEASSVGWLASTECFPRRFG